MATKKKPAASVEVKVQAARDEATVKAVTALSGDSVATKLAAASVEVQKKLAEVGGVVTAELAQLDDIRRTIELKKAELKDLYDIETAVVSLDNLKTEAVAVREEIEAAKAAWKKEEEEGDANLLKKRKRDEDDYAYQTGLRRRKEEDDHRAKLAAAESVLTHREATIRAAEKELADLRTRVEGLPALLESERNKAAAAARSQAEAAKNTELQLAKAAAEAAAVVANNKIAAAEAANKVLLDQNNRLQADIDRVRSDAKEIATKALEAGNRQPIIQLPQAPVEPSVTGRGGR